VLNRIKVAPSFRAIKSYPRAIFYGGAEIWRGGSNHQRSANQPPLRPRPFVAARVSGAKKATAWIVVLPDEARRLLLRAHVSLISRLASKRAFPLRKRYPR
jgi:hypothetical protein